MFDGLESERQGPEEVAPRGRRGRPRACPRRGLRGRDGQRHQLQHRVDLHLRAPPHLRLPRPPGQGEQVGQAPRPRLPRGRVRRLGRRAADRLGRPHLEAGRQGHRPLQLRRRPEPERARRLDPGRQPAHLGVRDQLRRPGRPCRGQGQPADAEAHPPHVGGGRGQRPVQLHLLPDARLHERRPDEAGGQGPGLGGVRWPGCLRRSVRPQRRGHPRRRGVLTAEGGAAPRPRRRGGDRPQGGRLPVLEGRAHPGRVGVAASGQGHPGPGRRRRRHRVRAPGPPDHGRVGLRRQARRASS